MTALRIRTWTRYIRTSMFKPYATAVGSHKKSVLGAPRQSVITLNRTLPVIDCYVGRLPAKK